MAVYKVVDKATKKVRLVEAPSASAAVKHVTTGMFDVATMQNVSETAKLMAGGTKLEVAGEPVPVPEPETGGDNEQAGDGKDKDPETPAPVPPGAKG